MTRRTDGGYPDGSHPYAGEAERALSFIQKWDGMQPEQTTDSMKQAADSFAALIEEKQITYADHTEGTLMTYLRLKRNFTDNSAITVVITTSKMMAGLGGKQGSLRLIETGTFGESGETYDYELSSDKLVVRRVDIGNEELNRLTGKTPRSVETRMGVRQGSDAVSASENVRNTALEDELGYNNQPIGRDEMEALRTLVAEAYPDISAE